MICIPRFAARLRALGKDPDTIRRRARDQLLSQHNRRVQRQRKLAAWDLRWAQP